MPQDDGFDELRDCHDSYYAAVAEMRRRWLAGEELPPEWTPKNSFRNRLLGIFCNARRSSIPWPLGRCDWHSLCWPIDPRGKDGSGSRMAGTSYR